MSVNPQLIGVNRANMCHGFEDDVLGDKLCEVLDEKPSPNGLPDGMLPGVRTAPGVPQPWSSLVV
ncbi:MAG: hypothetical protein KUG73_11890 [Pseudomonadales bacterium]|nr:hypothetical protein [Pseudomonadales bacterium]